MLQNGTVYMQIVGSLIWIQILRSDILFAILYLSWFTHKPRHHHLSMAYYWIGYIFTTIDLTLVLGGTAPLCLNGWTDASLGTGPCRRSVLSNISALDPQSGAIQTKATTSTSTCLSNFEAELDGLTTMLKTRPLAPSTYSPRTSTRLPYPKPNLLWQLSTC
jgi:hypothetical protein